MTDKIRVLIVDDHPIVRSGLRALLMAESDIEVIDEATDGKEGIEKTETLHPNVILMDISMPNMDGLNATRQIKIKFPDLDIVVVQCVVVDRIVDFRHLLAEPDQLGLEFRRYQDGSAADQHGYGIDLNHPPE